MKFNKIILVCIIAFICFTSTCNASTLTFNEIIEKYITLEVDNETYTELENNTTYDFNNIDKLNITYSAEDYTYTNSFKYENNQIIFENNSDNPSLTELILYGYYYSKMVLVIAELQGISAEQLAEIDVEDEELEEYGMIVEYNTATDEESTSTYAKKMIFDLNTINMPKLYEDHKNTNENTINTEPETFNDAIEETAKEENNTKEEIDNPKTGSSISYILVAVISIVGILLLNKKNSLSKI